MEGAKKGSNHSTVPMICRLWAAKWRQSHRVIAQATVPDAVHGPRRHLPQGLGKAAAAVPGRLRGPADAPAAAAAGEGRGPRTTLAAEGDQPVAVVAASAIIGRWRERAEDR